ncbi:hypothetical protein IID24_02225 [Patescibacteria group bacterium]|nr:hypothetical protein [Patescibacteria group bacterium]
MKQCAICGKTGNRVWRRVKLRGKYNPTVKRTQKPNLQWVRVPVDKNRNEKGTPAGTPGKMGMERVKACAKCIKAMAKT